MSLQLVPEARGILASNVLFIYPDSSASLDHPKMYGISLYLSLSHSSFNRNVGKLEAEKCTPCILLLPFFSRWIDCVLRILSWCSQLGHCIGSCCTRFLLSGLCLPSSAPLCTANYRDQRFMGFLKSSVNELGKLWKRSTRQTAARHHAFQRDRSKSINRQMCMLILVRWIYSGSSETRNESWIFIRIQVEKSGSEQKAISLYTTPWHWNTVCQNILQKFVVTWRCSFCIIRTKENFETEQVKKVFIRKGHLKHKKVFLSASRWCYHG